MNETIPQTPPKDYANPIAQCEQAVALHLAKNPRFAAEKVPVIANTQESAADLFAKAVSQNLGHAIVVTLIELAEITHTQRQTTDGVTYRLIATANFSVAVASAGIIASSKTAATTDLGYAVLKSLDGAKFSLPFLTALEFTGWQQADTSNGLFTSTLTFTAWIGLLEINT